MEKVLLLALIAPFADSKSHQPYHNALQSSQRQDASLSSHPWRSQSRQEPQYSQLVNSPAMFQSPVMSFHLLKWDRIQHGNYSWHSANLSMIDIPFQALLRHYFTSQRILFWPGSGRLQEPGCRGSLGKGWLRYCPAKGGHPSSR